MIDWGSRAHRRETGVAMKRRKSHQTALLRVLALLLTLSLIALFLPTPISATLRNVMQVIVPLQHAMVALTDPATGESRVMSPGEIESLIRQVQGYQQQVAALSLHNAQLENERTMLLGLRDRSRSEDWNLLPALVVAGDSLAWRESKLLDRGTLKGVRSEQLALSDYFLRQGTDHGVQEGMNIVASECLVGEVVEASTNSARLLLVTDRESRPRLVQIGRLVENRFEFLTDEFILHGAGEGRMQIDNVHHDLIDQQKIQIDDLVVNADGDDRLPLAVIIGRVEAIRRDDRNGLIYILDVRSTLDLNRLRQVYVVATSENQP
ncbi:MAG: hypothetical protein HJJLKODD_02927 [Phycisphaerae bacterium]|nr:hypothetical protein [Phycisphaerae bacterium]